VYVYSGNPKPSTPQRPNDPDPYVESIGTRVVSEDSGGGGFGRAAAKADAGSTARVSARAATTRGERTGHNLTGLETLVYSYRREGEDAGSDSEAVGGSFVYSTEAALNGPRPRRRSHRWTLVSTQTAVRALT
jgi:hypothetical protein